MALGVDFCLAFPNSLSKPMLKFARLSKYSQEKVVSVLIYLFGFPFPHHSLPGNSLWCQPFESFKDYYYYLKLVLKLFSVEELVQTSSPPLWQIGSRVMCFLAQSWHSVNDGWINWIIILSQTYYSFACLHLQRLLPALRMPIFHYLTRLRTNATPSSTFFLFPLLLQIRSLFFLHLNPHKT